MAVFLTTFDVPHLPDPGGLHHHRDFQIFCGSVLDLWASLFFFSPFFLLLSHPTEPLFHFCPLEAWLAAGFPIVVLVLCFAGFGSQLFSFLLNGIFFSLSPPPVHGPLSTFMTRVDIGKRSIREHGFPPGPPPPL